MELKVLNVVHGDSIILQPETGCKFDKKTFFIDLGPGQYDVTRHISVCSLLSPQLD